CILVKFSWHIPDFPIYSNGTKPGTLQPPKRLIHRKCNRTLNGKGKGTWVKHGPEWYAKHGQTTDTETGVGLDWPGGKIINW
ncbi:hypothetical protein QP324_10915, partial [Corynebacterium sp. UMB0012]|uniref:hypothetical protein n=1 Tax=Corynebacterium sp. UMB0012 TaxID=3046344 RepID=UPI002550733B